MNDVTLKLENINFSIGKKESFSIKDVSFEIPKGLIMGLIGENGAGKTTLIRLILNMYLQESGSIKIFGEEASRENAKLRDRIGVLLDQPVVSQFCNAKRINKILSNIYSNWDENLFYEYLDKLKIPTKKKIYKMSQGNIVKMQIAMALAHKPDLLILDEPMNHLDPVIRRTVIDMLREFMRDENHSILISSHLTGDLEKICDIVSFMHDGEIVFTKQMDDLQENWAIARLSEEEFSQLKKSDYIAYKKTQMNYHILTNKRAEKAFENINCENVSLEDIMYFYIELKEGEK